MSPGSPRSGTSRVRMIFIVGPASARGRGVGQQRHLTGVLDRLGDLTLLLGAPAGHPPGADLAAVGDELAQQGGVLVVDRLDAGGLERVGLLLRLAKRWLCHGTNSVWKSGDPEVESGKEGVRRAVRRRSRRRTTPDRTRPTGRRPASSRRSCPNRTRRRTSLAGCG